MPFTGPGFYKISSNADRGLLSYIPETRVLTVQGATASGTVFFIEEMGDGVYSIRSHDDGNAHFNFARIIPAPGLPYPLIIVNGGTPFPFRIAQSYDGEDYALIAAESTYAPRVWTAKLLRGSTLVVIDRNTEALQQQFTFHRVRVYGTASDSAE